MLTCAYLDASKYNTPIHKYNRTIAVIMHHRRKKKVTDNIPSICTTQLPGHQAYIMRVKRFNFVTAFLDYIKVTRVS